jgi:hypothetical protein
MGIMTQKRYDPICFSVMATTGTFRSDDIVYVFASIVMISLDLQNTKDCARIQSAQVCHFHIGRHFGIRGTKRRTFRTSTVNYSDVLGYPKFSHEQPREKGMVAILGEQKLTFVSVSSPFSLVPVKATLPFN